MSSDSVDDHASIPIKRVHEAYSDTLHARQQYVQIRPAGPSARHAARHTLHTAVGNYYETLRSIVKSSGRGTDFWEGDETHHLWTQTTYYVDTDDGHPIALHELPPDALTEDLLENAYEKTHFVGLDALEDTWADVSTTTKRYQDATGVHTSTTESADPLPVDVLFQAARLLDELAGDLGFLANPGTVVESDPTPV